jgi:predicted alpha/beta superfamily hydrolase
MKLSSLFYLLGLSGFCIYLSIFLEGSLFASGQNQEKESDEKVSVVLIVKVPSAPQHDREEINVFAAGNIEPLGKWRPDGLKLQRIDDRTYEGKFEAPLDSEIEFKMTQGEWKRVEKSSRGQDIPNRRLILNQAESGKPLRVEITVEGWSGERSRSSTVTGVVEYHKDIESKYLKDKRTVAVWLPPNYQALDGVLPVLYMQDGQNLFDGATAAFAEEWGIDETLTRCIGEKKVPPVIVVAVWNSPARFSEYTFTRDQRFEQGGNGEDYLRFLTDELKPFIDQKYRTDRRTEGTWIGGSSLGGLFALYAAAKRTDVFGGCFAFSPSLHWDEDRLLKDVEAGNLLWPSCRIWLSMGTDEGESAELRMANVKRAEKLAKAIRAANPKGELALKVFEGETGYHQEKSWRVQFPVAIEHMFSTDEQSLKKVAR